MNKATREYELNGWYITASEYHNDWDLIPILQSDKERENFRNNEEVIFDRLADAKKWVKTTEVAELKKKYEIKSTTKEIYLESYNELGELIKNNSKDFDRIIELSKICQEGQE